MRLPILTLLLTLALASAPALATPRTVTLDVQNMTCAVCPLTVRTALERVPGVQQVAVDYGSKTATVHFDDASATAEQLTAATTAAGYPSSVRGEGK